MLDKVNSERHEHIVTIEDPVEYLHSHKKCLVNQRELHSDTLSYANALRSALREDPDVVLIGEMRDLETIEAASLIPFSALALLVAWSIEHCQHLAFSSLTSDLLRSAA